VQHWENKIPHGEDIEKREMGENEKSLIDRKL
jgi:hypothetical protein